MSPDTDLDVPLSSSSRHMSREAWVLLVSMGIVWGIPYLFIKIAVTELSPVAVAGSRTLLAALVLVPLAARQGALRPALRLWPAVLAFGLIEMALPWVLLGHAEQRVPSGFAGLMIATVPLVGTVIGRLRGDRHAFAPVRLLGLGVGILGVAALVGLDSISGHVDALGVVELLVVAVGYAVAPAIADRWLTGVPAMGVVAISIGAVALLYLPWTIGGWSAGMPSTDVVVSVLVLAFVCTGLAFVLFFRLLPLVGPVRATVITFFNPAVAVVLGILVLGEPLTLGLVVGFPLVLLGAYWSTRTPSASAAAAAPA